MDSTLKKIEELEKFSNGAVLEFATSIYTPHLFSDGIVSGRVFKIENIVEIDENTVLDLKNESDPLYFTNNIHIRSTSDNNIDLTIPYIDEEEVPFYPVGTKISVDQAVSGGTITIKPQSGVTITETIIEYGDTVLIENVDRNIWTTTQLSFSEAGNILRSVINEKGVLSDDFVHGEKGGVLYGDPERPLHTLVTPTQPGFMGVDDKIKLDNVFLCPIITHIETPEIHRSMIYSSKFKSILYNEDLISPEWDYDEENPFHDWNEFIDYWGCFTITEE